MNLLKKAFLIFLLVFISFVVSIAIAFLLIFLLDLIFPNISEDLKTTISFYTFLVTIFLVPLSFYGSFKNKFGIKFNEGNKDEKRYKTIVKTASKILFVFFIAVFLIAFILYYITPRILNYFWGGDIEPINDSSMQLALISIPDSENAFYDLDKIKMEAIDISPEEDKVITNYNKIEDVESIREILDRNQKILSLYDSAAAKNQFQVPFYTDPSKLSFDIPVVAMGPWRAVSRLSSAKAIALARDGLVDEAINEAFKSIKIGDMIERSQGILIGYLVGISIKKMGIEVLDKIITENNISEERLTGWQKKLKNYKMSDNVSQFKMEYKMTKEGIAMIASTTKTTYEEETKEDIRDSFGVPNYMGFNLYYFKPNLTTGYSYDFYKKLIDEFLGPCNEVEIIKSESGLEFNGISDLVKAYFTENAIGRIMHGLATISLNNVIEKKCEVEAKINEILVY